VSDQSFQEKNEAPTPKKRKDAQKKGQVPRSQELNAAIGLLASALLMKAFAGPIGAGLGDLFGSLTLSVLGSPASIPVAEEWLAGSALHAFALVAPIVLGMAGTLLLTAGGQARGVLSADPIKPKWEKLDPIKNVPKVWGWKALHELGKSFLKMAVVAVAVWTAGRGALRELPFLNQQSGGALAQVVADYAVKLLLAAGLAYLVLAALDYAYQVWQHEKQLKMSKEEIKRETKESEGDPYLKARRRGMAQSLARRRMMLSVSDADVVVTNPTHVAVALKYDPSVSIAPMVLAMGERKVAERIKELARTHGVPTVENKPVARALLATAEVGEAIPVEMYVAVAEILAFVYRTRDDRPSSRGARVEAEA
jgi:flagellar biosynthetic protein FlhB